MADTDDIQYDTKEIYRKVAVITGASSGLGKATALEFADKGYNVVLTARRQNLLDEVAAECTLKGVQAITVRADMTDDTAVQRVASTAVVSFGHFDVWVNNAGVSAYSKFLDMPVEDFERVIQTNLLGYVHGAHAALSQFKSQGYGTLINVSSVNAAAPVPYASAYVASKYAIRGFSESLRMEMQLEGLADKIQIGNVMPASIDTNFFQNAANHTNREVVPLEPVYDPSYVAKNILKLAQNPQRELIVGPAGKMMVAQHDLSPNLYEKFMAKFVDKNHLGESPAQSSHGNLFDSIEENTGTRGGWREKRMPADQLNMIVGAVAGSFVALAGIGYLMSRKHRGQH